MICLEKLTLPFGEMLAGATKQGLCMLEFTDTGRLDMQIARIEKQVGSKAIMGDSLHFELLKTELFEYFAGKRQTFSVPLDIRGTEFQGRVWQALLDIPFGETRSYQEQAIVVGNINSVRAVANANRNNRISILIPCHRVIGKNGSMTGYGGGVWRKEFLLELEGCPQTTLSL